MLGLVEFCSLRDSVPPGTQPPNGRRVGAQGRSSPREQPEALSLEANAKRRRQKLAVGLSEPHANLAPMIERALGVANVILDDMLASVIVTTTR